MHAADLFNPEHPTVSFEFFPPKDAKGSEALFHHVEELVPLKPSYVSVTYGAGGGTRQLTQELVFRIKRETTVDVVPHLTCIYHTEAEIYDILEQYATNGIENILCLAGDPPTQGPKLDRSRDAFRHAVDLVKFVKDFSDRHGGREIKDKRGFGVGVAGFPEGHPDCPNRLLEIDYLKAKVDAGADFIITQLFFENRDFYDFRERCELAGIKIPIIAGVMPITSAAGMRRMAELAGGARFPAPLLRAIDRAVRGHGGDEAAAREGVKRVGVHWATEQCRDLLDHDVRGIDLYTLNRSTATREIYATLGIRDSVALR